VEGDWLCIDVHQPPSMLDQGMCSLVHNLGAGGEVAWHHPARLCMQGVVLLQHCMSNSNSTASAPPL
jgi:hypothetical protein